MRQFITAQYVTEDNQRITTAEMVEFCRSVPDRAELSPIIRDLGSQRDPDPVMVGIHAKWTTD